MSGIAIVMSTAGSKSEATRIGRELVERRLAACVNVLPNVVSIYRWEGSVQTDSEWLLLVKTRANRFNDVRSAIVELHSYELPEIVMIEPSRVDPAYRAWIDDSL
jgi:periplasmic divalent cation tolerance protein